MLENVILFPDKTPPTSSLIVPVIKSPSPSSSIKILNSDGFANPVTLNWAVTPVTEPVFFTFHFRSIPWCVEPQSLNSVGNATITSEIAPSSFPQSKKSKSSSKFEPISVLFVTIASPKAIVKIASEFADLDWFCLKPPVSSLPIPATSFQYAKSFHKMVEWSDAIYSVDAVFKVIPYFMAK